MSDAAGPALVCPAGHAFNLARSGYASLVVGGARPHSADSSAMLAARESFLSSGHYQPIAAAVAGAVAAGLAALVEPAPGAARGTGRATGGLVLDLAGGTGYYLAAALEACADARGLVLDLSAAAARRAARRHPRAAAATADAWGRLPLADASVSHAISVFGPRGASELARVLAPGAGLTVVTPTDRHLAQLRAGSWLVGIGGGKTAKLDRALVGFGLTGRRVLEYDVSLAQTQAVDLVMMGPNAFHLERAAVEARLAARDWPLALTVSVLVSRYRRGPERN
jgi:23S rRNA (guanine745-N1)-methyltransferase